MTSSLIYLGMGSNIPPSLDYLREGLSLLEPYLKNLRVASLYRTAPRDYTDQADFLNTAVCGQTDLSPRDWLDIIAEVEKSCHRSKEGVPEKGPRTLDVDILYWEGHVLDQRDLIVPHSALKERQFALIPLLELAPDLIDPESGQPYRSFLNRLEDQGVVPLKDQWFQG